VGCGKGRPGSSIDEGGGEDVRLEETSIQSSSIQSSSMFMADVFVVDLEIYGFGVTIFTDLSMDCAPPPSENTRRQGLLLGVDRVVCGAEFRRLNSIAVSRAVLK
jgi:hypothetical protein